jgi:hypothetical protein
MLLIYHRSTYKIDPQNGFYYITFLGIESSVEESSGEELSERRTFRRSFILVVTREKYLDEE